MARRCSGRGPDTARIYAWGENSPLKAYTFGQGKLQDVDNAEESAFRPPDGMPGGMLAVSANGARPGAASCGRSSRSTATPTSSAA